MNRVATRPVAALAARLRAALTTLLTTALLATGGATSYPQLDPEAMLARADIVAFAEVTGVATELRGDTPWTVVEFEVDTLLRFPLPAGDTPPARFTLAFLGGEAGGVRLAVAQMPAFELGDALLLLAYDRPYASPLVGFRQGAWLVRGGVLRDLDGELLGLEEDALVRGGDGIAPADLLPVLRERIGSEP